MVIDSVLRPVERKILGATVRAFADDIGIVVPNLKTALPILEDIFKDLEKIAKLSDGVFKIEADVEKSGKVSDEQIKSAQKLTQRQPQVGPKLVQYWP